MGSLPSSLAAQLRKMGICHFACWSSSYFYWFCLNWLLLLGLVPLWFWNNTDCIRKQGKVLRHPFGTWVQSPVQVVALLRILLWALSSTREDEALLDHSEEQSFKKLICIGSPKETKFWLSVGGVISEGCLYMKWLIWAGTFDYLHARNALVHCDLGAHGTTSVTGLAGAAGAQLNPALLILDDNPLIYCI